MNKLFTTVTAPRRAVATTPKTTLRLFVRDLMLEASVGAYDHEKLRPQRICLNLEFGVADPAPPRHDRLEEVVCYDQLVGMVRDIVGTGHTHLLETLAHRIADRCLADPRIRSVKIRIEKPGIMADAAGAGIELERFAG